jgi:GNAT superfamily N-acetyltransferase
MEVRFHESAEEFREIAEPLYRRDPVTHTVELTVLASGPLPADSLLLTVRNGAGVVGAALQTPPYPLACTTIPIDSADAVAAELARVRPNLHGVRGLREPALALADAWHTVTGRAGNVTVEERLYRLGTLHPPAAVPGGHRAPNDNDRGVLVDWVERFFAETFGHQRDIQAGVRFVDAAKDKGDQFLLWVVDGEPVSTAMLRAAAANVSRIGPVFTPRDRRGHGYASAVTAAAADLARRRGVADVVLFADLANSTSNAIYQKIGFEPVTDSIRIDFVTFD